MRTLGTVYSFTVSGVHRSSGVGKTFKSVSIVLGGQVRPRKCYGGGCKPPERRGVHDVEPTDVEPIGVDHVVFPVDEVDRLSVMPRAQRAAKYMTAMGLWRPPSGQPALRA